MKLCTPPSSSPTATLLAGSFLIRPSAFLIRRVPGLPWDNVQHYESRSLLSVVKNVKTPTLIMTGEEDYRTPMSESEQYYKALKLRGVEAVLVRVPGESHGIRGRPSHAIAKMTTLAGWFAKHHGQTP